MAKRKKSKVTRKNPNALTATRRIALEFKSFRVRVGYSTDMGASEETVKIAAINALGAPNANIPPRDAITPYVRSAGALIRRKHRSAVVAANRGKDPLPKLEALAAELKEGARQAVLDFSEPANAPSTIADKGFNDPLVGAGADQGRLVAEVNAAVFKR